MLTAIYMCYFDAMATGDDVPTWIVLCVGWLDYPDMAEINGPWSIGNRF